ncbi:MULTISPECIES: DUF3887 domain-containing protein [Dyella]|uniref:DUF3887 domain-containing protein n=2 Tax=Dyella TaxID=231454 RepID=A0A4R0Z1W0_9GAMM|nr:MULTISPECIES: DUF3887 domain-containing protein [Dyella]TBR38805.1 DUF3887 domain-containing protein [Dyella terrae]TCI13604.1 DUF3887 domain-containing protein [Dyella soli]
MQRVTWFALLLFTVTTFPATAENACESASARMLDALDRGDYPAATVDFNDTMKSRLTTDKLSEAWQAIPAQFGERGAREPAQSNQAGENTVVVTALHYGDSMIDAQVSCSADGKIAGFYIKPHH